MTLKVQYNGGRRDRISLVECPAPGCDKSWEMGDSQKRSLHFLKEHRPEDFGLSPLEDDDD